MRGRGIALLYQRQTVRSASDCGYVSPDFFSVNVRAFTEALAFNSCLNRKVSIDAAGRIRNCPALPAAYGAVGEVPLARAVAREDFRAVWQVTKDQVEDCRVCEFRYVCQDCRAHLRDPLNPRSKPARCTYDPWQARWLVEPVPGSASAVLRQQAAHGAE